MYTVGELRKMLKKYDKNLYVVIVRDGEGNTASELDSVGIGFYSQPITGWGIGEPITSEEDAALAREDEEKYVAPAVLLWPTI